MINSPGSSPTQPSPTSAAAPLRRRFVLGGRSAPLDPAIHAIRKDLADITLADRVFAPHYAQALAQKIADETALHERPMVDADVLMTLPAGAVVDLFDTSGGWAWVRSGDWVGYVLAEHLTSP